MNIHDCLLIDYLQKNVQNRIPSFQRPYTWEEKHCIRLIDDIIDVARSSRPNHFIGTILYRKPIIESGTSIRDIIDGQQRLTTISILFYAIDKYCDIYYCDESSNTNEKEDIKTQVNTYLFNNTVKEDLKPKIRLNGDSCIPYNELINNHEVSNYSKDRVIKNYKTISEYLDNIKVSPKLLIEGIQKLLIVDIEVNEIDNVNLIFETVNDRGKSLNGPDKIKNYILMTANPNTQENLYVRYWSIIEKDLVNNKKINKFIRYYLSSVMQKVLPKDDYYPDFKEYVQKSGKTIDQIVSGEFFQYYENYKRWNDSKLNDKNKINVSLAKIKETRQDIIIPTILCMLNKLSNEKINSTDKNYNKVERETIKILKVIESYFTRWVLCEKESKNLSDVWLKMLKSLSIEYSENSIKKCIKSLSHVQEMPNDDLLKSKLLTSKIYKDRSNRWCRYILDRAEQSQNKDYVYSNELSIEHIMPKIIYSKEELNSKSPELKKKYDWISILGNNYQNIHKIYLDTIGNLAISGYNSDYQNFIFSVKRNMGSNVGEDKKGYKYSTIKTTRVLEKYSTWTEKQIKDRANYYFNILKDIWPYI